MIAANGESSVIAVNTDSSVGGANSVIAADVESSVIAANGAMLDISSNFDVIHP